jgi:hypothetical protein
MIIAAISRQRFSLGFSFLKQGCLPALFIRCQVAVRRSAALRPADNSHLPAPLPSAEEAIATIVLEP